MNCENRIIATLVLPLITRTGQVLLAKKTKKIGINKRNGTGGRLEDFDTSLLECAIREPKEELGIYGKIEGLKKVGVGIFHNKKKDGKDFCVEVHFYTQTIWSGTPRSSSEMKNPRLYKMNKLPLRQMMPADRIVIPRMLHGELLYFEAGYTYRQKKLLWIKIQKVDKF